MCGMAEGHDIVSAFLTDNFDYLGFDYSENMVGIAKERKPTLNIEWNDVTTYQSTISSFDFIILIGGLHHVFSRTQDVLNNLGRSLKQGGYFVSFEPTHNNFVTRSVRNRIYQSNSIFDADTEQGFEYIDLEKYFKNAGFQKVDQVYPGLLAYVLYYNPDAFPALNLGGETVVRSLFCLDKLFWSNWIGRKWSFATMTLWKRS